MKTTLTIQDMHCASCASTIEDSLKRLDGVINVNVSYGSEEARIEHDETVTVNDLKQAIEDVGYSVDEEDTYDYGREAVKAWLTNIPILLVMIVMWSRLDFLTTLQINIILLVFATPVVLYFGRNTHVSALQGLRNKVFNMDSLISIGTLAAYLTSFLVFIMPIQNYGGVGAMIMASHLVGKYLENRAKGKASSSIQELMSLQADTATLQNGDVIDASDLEEGDKVIVKPGEKIPGDGTVIEGKTTVDESLVSGEPEPVTKETGDDVIGSTINQTGSVTVEITKVGQDSFLSQVVDLVKEAQSSKVPIQSLTDKITHYFVPTILVLALSSFLAWLLMPNIMIGVASFFEPFLPWIDLSLDPLTLALFASIATLVIACPCALGLATPTALMVGTGESAKKGVLYKDGAAIQRLTEIDTIVLDKTGTITEGKPRVEDVVTESDDLLSLAASLEGRSEHPLAQSIIDEARSTNTTLHDVEAFESVTGKGVKGVVDGKEIRVGNADFIAVPDPLKEEAQEYEKEAKTVVYVKKEDTVIGFITITDPIKKGSEDAIKTLQRQGLEVWMLTGDNEETAKAVAKKVGIQNWMSNVLPEDKLRKIETLQEDKVVAMVGDGINDAPALEKSDVGIAIGTGTDIAIESSDVSLVQGGLDSLVDALTISFDIFKKIKQNLVWAFIYNVIAVPIAFFGLLHPVMAVIAMFSSSLSVIGNSLRLKWVDSFK